MITSSTSGLLSDNISLSNYRSIFQYSNIANDDIDIGSSSSKETIIQKILRYSILTLAVILLTLTFPVSIWFSIKRIQPLKRCIIYRLGKRLPIKGPGMVFVLPCIDVLDFVDLSTQDVVVSQREQMLTQDGSVIEIIEFSVEISVSNAVRSSTHLKDSRFNVEQFIKLSFVNTIGSTHIEDLERKMEYIIRQFTDNCNIYINRWGWSVTASKLPNFVIINRAEQTSGVVRALKDYFNQGKDNPLSTLVNLTTNNSSVLSPPTTKKNIETDYLAPRLEKIITKYPYLDMISKQNLLIKLLIMDDLTQANFKLNIKTKTLEKSDPFEKEDVQIIAASIKDLEEALEKEDISKVQIKTNF